MYVYLLCTAVTTVLTTYRCHLTVFITIPVARKSPIRGIHRSRRFLPVTIAMTVTHSQSISLNIPQTQDILSTSILRLSQRTTPRIRIQVGPGQPVRRFSEDGRAVNLTMEDLLATTATMRRVLLT